MQSDSASNSAPVRFIVLGEGRSGSNLLVQALNSHPGIRCFGEVFNWTHARIDYGVPGYERRSLDDLGRRSGAPLDLLRERVWGEAPDAAAAVGFKLHYAHAYAYPGLEEALAEDLDVRIVHLRRENLLRLLVSMKRAEATGVWKEDASTGATSPKRQSVGLLRLVRHPASAGKRARNAWRRRRSSASGPPGALLLTPDECREFFIRSELQAQRYAALFAGHPTLAVTYEQMAADRESTFGSVLRFLDAEPRPLEVSLRRQNPQPLPHLVANFDELRAAFAGTAHAAYFDDGA